MDEAITARLGMDIDDFKKAVKEAVAEMEKGSKDIAKGTEKGSGIALASTGKLKKNLIELTGALFSGATYADLLADAALRLSTSFKLAGAASVGIAVGFAVYKQVSELVTKAHELRDALNDAFTPSKSVNFSTLEEFKSHLDAISVAAEKLKDSTSGRASGFFSTATREIVEHPGEAGKDFLKSGTSYAYTIAKASDRGGMRAASEQAGLRDEAQSTVGKMAEKQGAAADLEDTRRKFGQLAADLKRITIEASEKQGAITALNKGQKVPLDMTVLRKQVEREETQKKEAATDKDDDRKYSLAKTQISAQQGRGQEEELHAVNELWKIAIDRAEKLSNIEGEEPEKIAAARAELNEISNRYADIAEARAKATTHGREELSFMVLTAAGQKQVADEARIISTYEDKILQARKDSNTALEETLGKQRALAILQSRAREANKTPAQKRHEADEARKEKRGEDAALAQARDRVERKKRNPLVKLHPGDEEIVAGMPEKPAPGPFNFKEALHIRHDPRKHFEVHRHDQKQIRNNLATHDKADKTNFADHMNKSDATGYLKAIAGAVTKGPVNL